MAVTDFFAGEIATELLKQLITICRKSALCKASSEQLISHINSLLPIIEEIKRTGVELPQHRQRQLDDFSVVLRNGIHLCSKVLSSSKWNVYKNLHLARKMEKLERTVSQFVSGPMQAHVLADVHHTRIAVGVFDERFDRLEKRLASIKIGGGGILETERRCEGTLGSLGVGMELGKRRIKEMLVERDHLVVVGVCGIGGSGKTTLAREICKDDKLRDHFNNRVYFLTISQSPSIELLKKRIGELISGEHDSSVFPQWKLQCEGETVRKTLVVLDDVWSLSVLDQLITKVPGCKFLVTSRFKFSPSAIDHTYEMELLRDDEAMSLFCHFAFGQESIPMSISNNLVKQVVDECKGLPLALKVVGASLRDQPEMFWASAKNRLSRSQPICESHAYQLLERMKLSIDHLPAKVRECFLDLGCFPEDKKIPLDVLINMWVEIHDIDEEEAFAILVELSDKNLLTLLKDARAGDMFSSYFEISVSQHDVLRDLAIHLSNLEPLHLRRRLLMPRRETLLPKEWERYAADQSFNAQVISVHTGEMGPMDWFSMDCPKAEVLILNFSSSQYFMPPFISNMPNLRALIIINHSTSDAVLHNLSVFSNLTNLRSLWFEKVSFPQLPDTTAPLRRLRKISLILCNVKDSFNEMILDLPYLFPCLSEFTMDHCINLTELPPSICRMHALKSLSITNCDSLWELPADLGRLHSLQILRVYACPNLQKFPPGIGNLVCLKYLDISQCVNLKCLPEEIGGCISLEKIDMRECSRVIDLPRSTSSLRDLRLVICDEEVSWLWKDLELAIPGLLVQVAEECFNLDWLAE
ncbi:hypothetical protein LIER_14526 [Lithospermum erythrorhizon]|uniref:RPW8 domain-containing protein n=1 Tax=Lithospermum erythrorhizon TaxID=34254 RepID=A0AAV3Q114_LITER